MKLIHKLFLVAIGCLSFASCGAPSDFRYAKDEVPVSVMEDQSVDKIGNLEISIEDMERTRVQIYEITKKYDGYIYYEKYSTVNVDQHSARIKIALPNESFLNCYNDLRKTGIILSSEIKASLAIGMQKESGSATNAVDRPYRPSHLEVVLSQPANLGDYTKTTLNALGTFFNVALPVLLVIVIIMFVGIIGYFIVYLLIHSVIVKLHRKISSMFKKSK